MSTAGAGMLVDRLLVQDVCRAALAAALSRLIAPPAPALDIAHAARLAVREMTEQATGDAPRYVAVFATARDLVELCLAPGVSDASVPRAAKRLRRLAEPWLEDVPTGDAA